MKRSFTHAVNMNRAVVTVQLLIITCALQCEGVSLLRQLEHFPVHHGHRNEPMKTFYDPTIVSKDVAVPSLPSDLPQAMDILPGHTLIRPTLDVLKSAIKFPKGNLGDSSRVYGNINSVGDSINGNERLMNTGFRRSRNQEKDLPRWLKNKKVLRESSDEDYQEFKKKLMQSEKLASVEDTREDYDIKPRKHKPTIKKWIPPLRKEEALPKREYKIIIQRGLSEDDDKIKTSIIDTSIALANLLYSKGIDDTPVSGQWIQPREILLPRRKKYKLTELVPRRTKTEPEETDKSYVPPKKLVDYLNTRNLFDRTKISDGAPTLNELVPPLPKVQDSILRTWWFFNQDDFKPFLQ